MKTILASVYAVNPYKGSEDGTGWNFILQIARFNQVIAVTRENNRADIEKYLNSRDVPGAANIRFLYYDLPYWMRFWKKGARGALLYYYLWQIGLPRFVKKAQVKFDIVHNLNFHNDWTPSFLWKFKKPFVWGPVGHHPLIPKQFIQPVYGTGKWLTDLLRWKTKQFFWNADPFLSYTKRKADRILAINSDVQKVLRSDDHQLVLMPAVATNDMFESTAKPDVFNIISVGRFVALKGFDVTVRAFADFLNRLPAVRQTQVRLILVGTGPELPFLIKLANELQISDQLEILPWVAREEMNRLYASSRLFLFPSHEGAGMVVPEALSCGLPVVCFDNSGPGEFIDESCGMKIPYTTYPESVKSMANALFLLYENPSLLKQKSDAARKQFEQLFQWDRKGDILKNIYNEISLHESSK
jgi:glycosyltransferase involved in cell wall biosynthesis